MGISVVKSISMSLSQGFLIRVRYRMFVPNFMQGYFFIAEISFFSPIGIKQGIWGITMSMPSRNTNTLTFSNQDDVQNVAKIFHTILRNCFVCFCRGRFCAKCHSSPVMESGLVSTKAIKKHVQTIAENVLL